MDMNKTQPFVVALVFGTGELNFRVYNAKIKEEAKVFVDGIYETYPELKAI